MPPHSLLSLCALLAIASAPLAAEPTLQLVWSDEFTTEGPLDPAKWTYERGFVRNNELQWYQPENAVCREGMLVIEGRRETKSVPERWRRGGRREAQYTSASVTTQGRAKWLYGRFEIRARFPARPGLWPALWTLGEARGWPGGGEIDIMEYYAGVLLANAAYANADHTALWDSVKTPLAQLGDKHWDEQFHVWRMDWNAEKILLSVDDRLLNEISVASSVNATPDGANPFREPHYLLLNLAIGGDQGGDPSATAFPAKFEIDYVRVWQK